MWRFEVRLFGRNPATLCSGLERGEGDYLPRVLCCLWFLVVSGDPRLSQKITILTRVGWGLAPYQ